MQYSDYLEKVQVLAEHAASEPNESYPAMLMRLYPHRVLRYLESLSNEEIAKVAAPSDEEANANYHQMMLRETAKHGCD